MSNKEVEYDDLDLKILSILVNNARTPYSVIGEKLHVSGGTVHVRIKKLEQNGIALKQQLKIAHEKLGYDITAFLGLYLTKSSMYESVVAELKKIPEVLTANYTTGSYSMLVKIICRDTNHLRVVIYDKIQHIEGVQRTETLISLEESINRPLELIDIEA